MLFPSAHNLHTVLLSYNRVGSTPASMSSGSSSSSIGPTTGFSNCCFLSPFLSVYIFCFLCFYFLCTGWSSHPQWLFLVGIVVCTDFDFSWLHLWLIYAPESLLTNLTGLEFDSLSSGSVAFPSQACLLILRPPFSSELALPSLPLPSWSCNADSTFSQVSLRLPSCLFSLPWTYFANTFFFPLRLSVDFDPSSNEIGPAPSSRAVSL